MVNDLMEVEVADYDQYQISPTNLQPFNSFYRTFYDKK